MSQKEKDIKLLEELLENDLITQEAFDEDMAIIERSQDTIYRRMIRFTTKHLKLVI